VTWRQPIMPRPLRFCAKTLSSRGEMIPDYGQKFACIVADPPWDLNVGCNRTHDSARCVVKRGKWGDPRQDNSKIADLQYPTMTVPEICALQLPSAKDAHCYIWTVNKYIEATYGIARAWGFEPSCLLTWIKAPMGLGLGGTFCNTSEFILFARRGKLKAKRRIDTTWFAWPRGAHSEKPEGFQNIVESVSPGPYLELFARRERSGWTCWGNQVAPAPIEGTADFFNGAR
jgi:N6-adenosine-specific RNA methylase IME4